MIYSPVTKKTIS